MPSYKSFTFVVAFLVAEPAYIYVAQADPTVQLSPPTLTPSLPNPNPAPVVKEQSAPVATAAEAAPICSYEAIYSINSANLEWPSGAPLLKAYGTVRTGGWSNGTLLPVSRSDDGTTLTLRFVACPPGGYSTQALASIEAQWELTENISQLRYIVITTETGSQTLDMSRYR